MKEKIENFLKAAKGKEIYACGIKNGVRFGSIDKALEIRRNGGLAIQINDQVANSRSYLKAAMIFDGVNKTRFQLVDSSECWVNQEAIGPEEVYKEKRTSGVELLSSIFKNTDIEKCQVGGFYE